MPTYYQMAKERDKEKLLEQLRNNFLLFIIKGYSESFVGDGAFEFFLNIPVKDLLVMNFWRHNKHEPQNMRFGQIVVLADEFLRLEEMDVSDDITLAMFIETFMIDKYVS